MAGRRQRPGCGSVSRSTSENQDVTIYFDCLAPSEVAAGHRPACGAEAKSAPRTPAPSARRRPAPRLNKNLKRTSNRECNVLLEAQGNVNTRVILPIEKVCAIWRGLR